MPAWRRRGTARFGTPARLDRAAGRRSPAVDDLWLVPARDVRVPVRAALIRYRALRRGRRRRLAGFEYLRQERAGRRCGYRRWRFRTAAAAPR